MEKIFAVKKRQKLIKLKQYNPDLTPRQSHKARVHSKVKFKKFETLETITITMTKNKYDNDRLNLSFSNHTEYDYGDDFERYYFSDNESRRKEVDIHKTINNKYEAIIYFNDYGLELNKKLIKLIKHPKLQPPMIINTIDLVDRQIKKWKTGVIVKDEDIKPEPKNEEAKDRTKAFMMGLIKNLEVHTLI